MNFKFPQFSAIALDTIVTNCSADGIAFLQAMLMWNPSKRPTAAQALKDDYFIKTNQKLGPQSVNSTKITNNNQRNNISNFGDWNKSLAHMDDKNNSNSRNALDSPNVDNTSIQQLQQQLGTHASRNSLLKSGLSVKDQYLSRTRYIAGQNTKNATYRNSGELYKKLKKKM